ncbi:hypothetical protein [Ralstonia syzygii]|uniref:Knr4/Smi1-like domain-containing protein n=1 Tax=Ralstonia syzygii R24 TaxID=907261 RepID=G3A1J2_9RALS|nr:hypothetical protein [Ralstonia syzygii]CCA85092.1 conserved hypothetical protein [Ralstonia syzygii R24]
MKKFFYDISLLPEGFGLPSSYLNAVLANNFIDIEPWGFLCENVGASLLYYGAMLQKFPESPIIPFAMVNDQSGLYNDGWVVLACFDGGDKSGDPRVLIYDYSRPASNPWDNVYVNFSAWLAMAGEESVRYKEERDGAG